MADEPIKQTPKQKFIRKLSICASLLAIIAVAALAGWLGNSSPFWAGILIGLCPGVVLGFTAGVAAVAIFAADNPQEFINKVETHLGRNS